MKWTCGRYGFLSVLFLLSVAGRGQAVLRSLELEPGASLHVQSTGLSVTDSACFRADQTGYAQVIGAVDGLSVYEMYLQADSARWFNLAFPVDTTLYAVKGVPLQATGNPRNTTIWYYDPTADADTNGEGDFIPVPSLSYPTALTGFQLYAGDGVYTGTAPFTAKATGPLIDGDQDLTVSAATDDNFNLLPNPFPSTLNWQQVFDDADNSGELQATYYIQDGSINDSDYTYRYYHAQLNEGANGGTANIPPGQSFFVQVTDATDGVIAFKNAHRNLTGNSALYKTQAPYDFFCLGVRHMGSQREDRTYMVFDAGFSDSIESVDAVKMRSGGYPNIYTALGGRNFLFNGIGNQFASRSLGLHFEADYSGTYEMTLLKDAVPAHWSIQVEDKQKGNIADLRSTDLVFSHNAGNAKDRFVLHINTSAAALDETSKQEMYAYLRDGTLYVQLPTAEESVIALYDAGGRRLVWRKTEGSVAEIEMEGRPDGLYLLTISRGGASIFAQKVVKR